MAEIFQQTLPADPLEMTGERLVTGVGGLIEAEHLHRYFLARDLCRGKDVLDIASGEGYGSALLAQTATTVVGVDIDRKSVAHAARAYARDNLRYLVGNATAIPLDDRSVDAVVSFETLEHFDEHEKFLSEARRVLRPGGFLVISTPDAGVYSGQGTSPNPFHRRELTDAEFAEALRAAFPSVLLLRQRTVMGSALVVDPGQGTSSGFSYERRGEATFESHRRLPRATFLLAIASDRDAPHVAFSLYVENDMSAASKAVQAELERLLAVEQLFREQSAAHNQLAVDMQRVQTELQRLLAVEQSFREHLTAHAELVVDMQNAQTELQRLLAVEQSFREHLTVHAELVVDMQNARTELHLMQNEDRVMRTELERLRTVEESARAQLVQAASEHGGGNAAILLRQQALTIQRLNQEIQRQARECDEVRGEAARYAEAYRSASSLIVPIWIRQLAPTSVRRLARRLNPNRGRR